MIFAKSIFKVTNLFCLFLFAFCISLPMLVNAQEVGVSIRPAMIEESLDPGDIKDYTLTIENLNSQEQLFYLFTKNISGVREGGSPIFAINELEKTGYELSDWITLPTDQILLEAGEQKVITISLKVPEDATPGSHFGGVFFSVDPPKIESSGAAVGYQVANIVSIRVSGDVIEDANIRQFSTSKYIYGSQDVDFSVRIENKGNVLVRAYGPLQITNMLGNEVGSLIFNEEQSAVFPGITRSFDIKWEGDSLGFGRYEAVLTPIYGNEGAKKTMYSTVSFWILPMNIIFPAVGIFALFLLIIFIFVRLYIRRSLGQLNHGGRRIIRQKRKGNPSAFLLFTIVALTVTALFLIILLALFA